MRKKKGKPKKNLPKYNGEEGRESRGLRPRQEKQSRAN